MARYSNSNVKNFYMIYVAICSLGFDGQSPLSATNHIGRSSHRRVGTLQVPSSPMNLHFTVLGQGIVSPANQVHDCDRSVTFRNTYRDVNSAKLSGLSLLGRFTETIKTSGRINFLIVDLLYRRLRHETHGSIKSEGIRWRWHFVTCPIAPKKSP
jgi:hypothetical protein